jgi:hypothetical protein
MLLIENKERAMQLVAGGMVDPRRALALCGPVGRIGATGKKPRLGNQVLFESDFVFEKFVQRGLCENSLQLGAQRPLALNAGTIRKQRDVW